MKTASLTSDCKITLHIGGSKTFPKMSFPVHSGIYNKIETDSHVFHFNLNNEIIRAKSKGTSWKHPHEWLKRTIGNDWIYYSTGGYSGVFEATGEYYLPNFNYSTNNILGGKPFNSPIISNITSSWPSIIESLKEKHLPNTEHRSFLDNVLQQSPARLQQKADRFHKVIDGYISVLPPDARHVSYNLIPVLISRGCLYKCRFCKVKNRHTFRELDYKDIDQQITNMKKVYNADLINYNSIFLGEHDALQADCKTILYAIEHACKNLDLYDSYLDNVNCFLFGSATSLLEKPDHFFKDLSELPGKKYINIGLESPDQETLDQLGKPISTAQVWDCFKRIQSLNLTYSNIEVSSNFIMESQLPSGHYKELEKLIRETQTFSQPKGSIYFSPLTFDKPSRARLFEFNRLKLMSRFPTFLYIIQRL